MNPEMERSVGGRRPARGAEHREHPLVPDAEVGAIEDRWRQIKASFVDDPRGAVRQADRLVGDAVEVVSQAVARKRSKLASGLSQGDGPNTEELRRALRGYQDLLERFLG